MLVEEIVLLVGSGAILSYQDFVHRKVNIVMLAFYTAIAIVSNFRMPCVWPLLVFVLIGLVYWMWQRRQVFGAADYVIVAANGFIIDGASWPMFTIFCGLFGVMFGLFFKDTIPFVPIIFLATLSTTLA